MTSEKLPWWLWAIVGILTLILAAIVIVGIGAVIDSFVASFHGGGSSCTPSNFNC